MTSQDLNTRVAEILATRALAFVRVHENSNER